MFALLPIVADAAGTYYTGGYQSPQSRYGQANYNQGGYARTNNYSQQGLSAYSKNQYSGYAPVNRTNVQQQNRSVQQVRNQSVSNNVDDGFSLGAGFARQSGMWQFEMKNSASVLHYDNIDWNVFDINAGYVFGNNTKIKVNAGLQYGMQAGESTMVDDDITNGGYQVAEYKENGTVVGYQVGNALSIGTSKDGSMFGFNAGVGIKDFFSLGKLKVTPSVGWRYLKYDLETHDNHGMSLDYYTGDGGCIVLPGSDEIQCDPAIVFYDGAELYLLVRDDTNLNGEYDIEDLIPIPTSGWLDTGSNYYYAQPGISHKYEVEWSGPYLALDMLYDITQHSNVNAYLELGLPSYTAVGDQPYRFDWLHPKSVEDSKGIGGAFHLGLGANWTTALTDSVALSIGVTYDHYNVSGADAKTYLNSVYYNDIYDALLADWTNAGMTESEMLDPEFVPADPKMVSVAQLAQDIKEIEADCPGWVCSASGEIKSFYKSLGIHVGINAKF